MKVLILDTDHASGTRLARAIEDDGAVVDVAVDPLVAAHQARGGAYGAVVVCVERVVEATLDWCRDVRGGDCAAAILVVADHAGPELVVAVLDAGADDCVTRPLTLAEVAARLRAIARRADRPRAPELRGGGLRLDPGAHRVWRGDVELEPTATEFALLAELMRHAGEALTRAELLDLVWGRADRDSSNVVDQVIARLRRVVDEPFGTTSVETVRGVGYRLVADGAPDGS